MSNMTFSWKVECRLTTRDQLLRMLALAGSVWKGGGGRRLVTAEQLAASTWLGVAIVVGRLIKIRTLRHVDEAGRMPATPMDANLHTDQMLKDKIEGCSFVPPACCQDDLNPHSSRHRGQCNGCKPRSKASAIGTALRSEQDGSQ